MQTYQTSKRRGARLAAAAVAALAVLGLGYWSIVVTCVGNLFPVVLINCGLFASCRANQQTSDQRQTLSRRWLPWVSDTGQSPY